MRVTFTLFVISLVSILSLTNLAVTQEAMADSYLQAARSAYDKEDYEAAKRYARLAMSEAEKLKSKDDRAANRTMIAGLNSLNAALIAQKRWKEAESTKLTEVTLLEHTRSNDYPAYEINYPMSLDDLGEILLEQGKYEESEDVYRKALDYREKIKGDSDKSVATSLINIGTLYLRQKKYSEAEAMDKRALSILGTALEKGELNDDDLFTFLRAAKNLAEVNVETKNYAEAEKEYKFIIMEVEKLYGQQDSSLIEPLEEYAKLLRILNRSTEAARVEARIKQLQAKQ